jgi:hypothetical protein
MIPVVEVAGGEVCGAPVACAGLAGLFAAGAVAQILSETTRATRQLAPAALSLRWRRVSGVAIGGGSETAEQSAGVGRRVIVAERARAQTT